MLGGSTDQWMNSKNWLKRYISTDVKEQLFPAVRLWGSDTTRHLFYWLNGGVWEEGLKLSLITVKDTNSLKHPRTSVYYDSTKKVFCWAEDIIKGQMKALVITNEKRDPGSHFSSNSTYSLWRVSSGSFGRLAPVENEEDKPTNTWWDPTSKVCNEIDQSHVIF